MEQINSIALSDDFIRRLVDTLQVDFIQKNIPLEKVAIVFSGKRPDFFLKKALAKKISGAYFPPAIFSMDEFIKEVSWRKGSTKKISSLDAAFCIYELAKLGCHVRSTYNPCPLLRKARTSTCFVRHIHI